MTTEHHVRPHLIDLLFLRSFPGSFQWVERDKKLKWKEKCEEKNTQKWKEKLSIFFKNYFLFPGFFQTFFNNKCTEGSEKQQIIWVWPYCKLCPYPFTYICFVIIVIYLNCIIPAKHSGRYVYKNITIANSIWKRP